MPLGPSVLFTKSPIAMAPIKEDWSKNQKLKVKISFTVLKFLKYNWIFKRMGEQGLPAEQSLLSLHQLQP